MLVNSLKQKIKQEVKYKEKKRRRYNTYPEKRGYMQN